MRPSFNLPEDTSRQENKSNSKQAVAMAFQTWQASGSCPEGTIPIIRFRKTLRGSSVGKKNMLITGNRNGSSFHFNPSAEAQNNVSIGFLPNRAVSITFT